MPYTGFQTRNLVKFFVFLMLFCDNSIVSLSLDEMQKLKRRQEWKCLHAQSGEHHCVNALGHENYRSSCTVAK